MNSSPGIFSVHSGTNLRFFDTITPAQDWAEQFSEATIRKEYESGWKDIAKWNGTQWSYSHYTAKQKRKRS